jgi:hypothetical protein
MTPAEALAFVERHGLVLEATRRAGIVSLADAVAGEPIRGSWWAHPASRAIFAATRAVREAPEILVCRLVDGKISFVHRRLWPALARLAERFPAADLARLHEVHTTGGAHRVEETPFPTWLPQDLREAAQRLRVDEAEAALAMLARIGHAS